MNYERNPSIAERIANDDYTIIEADFFTPVDNRTIKNDLYENARKYYHEYYEDFNELIEIEELFDSDFN